jgi:Fe-S-cluster containining protein
MDLTQRRMALRHLYAVHDRFADTLRTACGKHCAACCTPNVTATTLEAFFLAEAMADSSRPDLMDRARAGRKSPRRPPKVTTNRMAEICLAGDDPPEEEPADPAGGACALLTDAACPVYEARPFACRCMVSARRCAEGGAADMAELTVTVNTVFLQTLEHIDADGYSGNLVDLLDFMAAPENRRRYREGRLSAPPAGLIPNRPAPALMIPPEHRAAVRPWIEALRRMPTGA